MMNQVYCHVQIQAKSMNDWLIQYYTPSYDNALTSLIVFFLSLLKVLL